MRFRGDRPVEYRARRGARLSMASPKTQALREQAIVPRQSAALSCAKTHDSRRDDDNFAHGLGAGHTRSRRLPDLAGGDEPATAEGRRSRADLHAGLYADGNAQGSEGRPGAARPCLLGRRQAFSRLRIRHVAWAAVDDRGRGLRSHPLLDDVDYIAAVSGGSFPAMHYGLYREKSFETFEHDFLKRDVNAYIFGIYLLPWNWEWLINPLFGTNDAMAAVYDRLLFHGATYADLIRRGLPMISVDATDIAGGVPFPFNQASFDLLCSDLPSFPVSRAVAASAGLPILFTPITLTSYRSNCTAYPPPGAPPPDWREHAATLSRQTGPGPQCRPADGSWSVPVPTPAGWRYLGQSGAAVAVERAGSA